jgi:hypothetical protein
MRNSFKLIVGLTSLAAIGVAIYFARKDRVIRTRHEVVSDEGYETAYDILYPLQRRRYLRG